MCYFSCNSLVLCDHVIESPQYIVVLTQSDFEVRLYRESSWMSALVRGTTSFEGSTKDGFHRLYEYIHGTNLNSSLIPMSAPVLTTITSSSPSEYCVRLYLSGKYERPPQPSPELNLQLDQWQNRCIAVRKFYGFAKDDNVSMEFEALLNSLNKYLDGHTSIVEDKSSYTIAQYNASHHLTGRLNEVWISVLGTKEGCLPPLT
ncbi:hypothetical protein FNV43_RR25951 [Rhamnella rubrinervis]|uniref:Heme-binding protein 2 n=1 Tax=Rhamnella rubrinervis TaxID=2594499 RepID=A0A8K0DM16_9ROSA|nr:hypothetical protein FNV43_RR25951 [Rhamnella rubrinervis]